MGKSSPAPPPAPDPRATANAQAAANEQTARVQATLNRVNQTTPWGSITYDPIPGQMDRWQSNITLTPNQQAINTGQEQTAIGLTNLANQQLPRVGAAMNSQIDTSRLPDPIAMQGDVAQRSREVADSLYNTGLSRLQPQFDRQRDLTFSTLADRGIGAGSGDAWTNALRDERQIYNDALTQLSGQATQAAGAEQNRLTGLATALRQGDIQEQDWFRSQPIRDISALLGTSPGGTTPQFTSIPQVGVAPTDVVGPINTQYQSQMAGWNAQNQARNQAMGGLFSLGGTALGAGIQGSAPYWAPLLFSDRRLKRDIRRVGQLANGLPVYLYRFTAGGPMQIGLMADEVEKVRPAAVHDIGGFQAVDYAEASS